jgi:hypothetical protein
MDEVLVTASGTCFYVFLGESAQDSGAESLALFPDFRTPECFPQDVILAKKLD